MPIADIVMAIAMYVVSGVMFWQMQSIKSPDSKIFPTAVAIIIIVLATILLLKTIFGKEKASYDFKNTTRGLKILGLLFVFAVCSYWFGFFTCVPFFLVSAMYLLGQRNKVILIVVPIVMTIVVILLFDVLFSVRIPDGSVFDLYRAIFS